MPQRRRGELRTQGPSGRGGGAASRGHTEEPPFDWEDESTWAPALEGVAAEIGEAAGREIRYTPVSLDQHAPELAEHGVPPEFVDFLTYLFEEVVDGCNADTSNGVRRALGREARDFRDSLRGTAATGIWSVSAVNA
jgi:hypothetical protein